jgi:pimeloyl-ACP methyl ester carboxylesterase/DNA-binding CsgD family transcriptional regulator
MTIHFTTGSVKLAYECLGEGEPPLVAIPGWVSHLQMDRDTPFVRDFYERLARHRRLVHYDKRGTGLSDRPSAPETFALETRVDDLATVMDAAGVRRAALLGWSEGGPIGIAFAARYPERVSRLILYGTTARSLWAPDFPCGTDPARSEAFTAFVAAEWGMGSRFLAMQFLPEGDGGLTEWFTAYQRAGVSPQDAVEARRAWTRVDVRALLPEVRQPTLVLHRRYEPSALARAEYLAANLPNARLEVLGGDLHLPYLGDSVAVTDAIDRFLAEPDALPAESDDGLTRREREVAALVARGLTNRQIADALSIGERTVHTHVSNLLGKLSLATRAQVATWATAHGLRASDAADGDVEPRIRLVR